MDSVDLENEQFCMEKAMAAVRLSIECTSFRDILRVRLLVHQTGQPFSSNHPFQRDMLQREGLLTRRSTSHGAVNEPSISIFAVDNGECPIILKHAEPRKSRRNVRPLKLVLHFRRQSQAATNEDELSSIRYKLRLFLMNTCLIRLEAQQPSLHSRPYR